MYHLFAWDSDYEISAYGGLGDYRGVCDGFKMAWSMAKDYDCAELITIEGDKLLHFAHKQTDVMQAEDRRKSESGWFLADGTFIVIETKYEQYKVASQGSYHAWNGNQLLATGVRHVGEWIESDPF